jgi:hypothetical protein
VRAATAPVIATMDGDGPERSCRYHAALGPARLRRVASLPWLRLREGRKAKGSRRAASRFANWIRATRCLPMAAPTPAAGSSFIGGRPI